MHVVHETWLGRVQILCSWMAIGASALGGLIALAPTLWADQNTNQGEKTSGINGAERAARDILAEFEKSDPGWKRRMESLVLLVKSGPAAVPVLVDTVKNGSPTPRGFAAQVLAVLVDPSTRPALIQALGNAEGGISRIYAIKALSMLGRLEPTDDPYRQILAKDPDWWVRRYLAWAFERDDSPTRAAEIRQALTVYDPSRIDTARLDELAPDFSLSDAFGKTYRLSDFRGKTAVVLVFYDEGL